MSPAHATILLVEHSAEAAPLILGALAKGCPDARLEWVTTESAALDVLFHTGKYASLEPGRTPSLVFINVDALEGKGLQLLRIMKSYARTRVIPVVVLIDYYDAQLIASAYGLGATSCLSKIIGDEKFQEAIEYAASYWLTINQPAPEIKRNEPMSGH